MAVKSKLAITITLCLTLGGACAPRRLALPEGPGTPSPEALTLYEEMRSRCGGIRTLQAELTLSGRAGTQRIRGRILAGIVPGALRLEGVAPFGSPVFILVAEDGNGTLLLPRDRRIIRNTPPEQILDALVGVQLNADDLLALLAGCVTGADAPSNGRAYGERWRAVDVSTGGSVYFALRDGMWRPAGGRANGLSVEYSAFSGRFPSQVRLSGASVDLSVVVADIETNVDLPRDELVAVKVPAGVEALSVGELRRAGPLGE